MISFWRGDIDQHYPSGDAQERAAQMQREGGVFLFLELVPRGSSLLLDAMAVYWKSWPSKLICSALRRKASSYLRGWNTCVHGTADSRAVKGV